MSRQAGPQRPPHDVPSTALPGRQADIRIAGLAGLSTAAGALALAVLGVRDWPSHLAWAALLGLSIGGLLWAVRACAAGALQWRAAVLAHAALWGALAWMAPAAGGGDLEALMLLQGGVAVAGGLLLLAQRPLALAFTALAAVPLTARLLGDPGTAIVSVAALGLLLLSIWLAGAHQARAQQDLLAARLGQTRQAERAGDADRLLARVFEQVGEGICIFDAGFTLRAANPRIVQMLDLPASLLAPGTPLVRWLRHLAEGGHYGEVDVEAEVARRLAELARPQPETARRHRPDGSLIETRRSPLPEGGFAIVCVDITERAASQAALFDNRRTLDVLLQQTEEGFWFIDNQHRTTDANPAMRRLLGVSREALLGRTTWEFMDADNEAAARVQAALREQGQASTYEVTLTRADGTRVACVNNATPIHDARGRKIGAIGLFSNISALRAAEAAASDALALAAEKSRVLEHTLDSLAQGVLGFDAKQRLHSWNRRALELLELPLELVERRPTLTEIGRWQHAHGAFGPGLALIENPQARESVRLQITEQGGVGEEPEVYRRRRPDGRVLEVRSHIDADGCQVRTYTDVTQEVRAAQEMTGARDEAERANRAKSEFLSRMSHELRTPLNAILGFAQLMRCDAAEPLGAQQHQRLAQIVDGGQHLLAQINEVLDLARIETGALQLAAVAVDADAVVDACWQELHALAGARAVRLQPRQGSAGTVLADAPRLRQVLLNLLGNAISYNCHGGEVTLRCSADAHTARIEVVDTGPGLSEAQQRRLFTPFEPLHADGAAGAGIGLALCRSLVDLMGGRIGVRSAPGQGSCFWVELPCAIADAHPVATPQSAIGEQPRRVLYVEDNTVNQLLMQGMLAHRPQIELTLAASAEDGLTLARARIPELVLMDIQLPGASGYELLQAMRAEPALRPIAVLAVSANAMPADVERARAAGFDGYLTKPLDLQELLDTVDHWLAAATA